MEKGKNTTRVEIGSGMNQSDNFNDRNYIYIMKALALFSIVSAHVGIVSNHSFINIIFSRVLSSIGSIGVGVFFVISGYLYMKTNKTFLQFVQAKAKSILIPWVCCGTVLFYYVTIRKGDMTIENWFMTLTVHSHLYYLSVLMILYIVFWRLKRNIIFIIVQIILSVISIYLTSLGAFTIYPYINPFNWAVYFALGVMMYRYKLLEKLALFANQWLSYVLGLYLLIMAIYIINGTSIGYWTSASVVVELVALVFFFGLSGFLLDIKHCNWIIQIGKMSFSIYLLHTPVAGFISLIFDRFNLWYLALLMPFIVIAITITGIQLIRFISRILKVNKIIDLIIGIR